MLTKKFSKMNSKELLRRISKGGGTTQEAKVISTILERRFPTPIPKFMQAA